MCRGIVSHCSHMFVYNLVTQLSFGPVPQPLHHFTSSTLIGDTDVCACVCHGEVFHLSIRTAVVHKNTFHFLFTKRPNCDPVLLTPLCKRSCKGPAPFTLASNGFKLTSLCFKTDPQILLCSARVRSQCSASFVSPLQVSIPVDYSNPPTVKNHNEVLRCFSLLGIEALVYFFVFM